ncbi:MAG: acyl-CoA carboxylase subunit beta, partial [Actinomycetota bacterium]|nr:acyl-CoA carboxylase subunit beta [Actinomycetota bacterium]
MPVLKTALDTGSQTYRQNRDAQLAAVEALNSQLELTRAGGGPRYEQRHHARGRLLVRERLELLLDP